MTDLPYGRGVSPLQNLIKAGHKTTMLTALHCGDELDGGDVYLKKPLDLYGSAEEIFIRADYLIEEMIEQIVLEEPKAKPQEGVPVIFRRQPHQSNLADCSEGDANAWYDQICMLDAEDIPCISGSEWNAIGILKRANGMMAPCDVKIVPISKHNSIYQGTNP